MANKENPIVQSTFSHELREIYRYRNILKSLVKKNLIGKYKNSILGFGWHFVTPIVMLLVYYIAFSTIKSNPIENFWAYLGTGIFPFSFMLNNLNSGTGCLVSNAGMIKKIYFPRELIILAQTISTTITMLIGFVVILTIMIIAGIHISPYSLLILIVIIMLMFIFVLGYVMFFSSINVYFRDIQYAITSISMLFFFLTPIYFLAENTTDILSSIIWWNPFTYFIEGFHYTVFWGLEPPLKIIVGCTILAFVSLSIGVVTFKKLKHGFAERL